MYSYSIIDRNLDRIEELMVKAGLLQAVNWELARAVRRLYAGKLRRGLPQFHMYILNELLHDKKDVAGISSPSQPRQPAVS